MEIRIISKEEFRERYEAAKLAKRRKEKRLRQEFKDYKWDRRMAAIRRRHLH